MMHSMWYIAGVIVGALICLGIAFLAAGFCRKKWGTFKSEYDERQKQAIGKAYRDGFWSMFASIVIALGLMYFIPGYEHVFVSAACFIGVSVYAVSCILRDAYMGLNDNASRWTVLMIVIGVVNIIGAAANMKDGFWNGWFNLLCAALMFLVVIVYGIKAFMDKRTGE